MAFSGTVGDWKFHVQALAGEKELRITYNKDKFCLDCMATKNPRLPQDGEPVGASIFLVLHRLGRYDRVWCLENACLLECMVYRVLHFALWVYLPARFGLRAPACLYIQECYIFS